MGFLDVVNHLLNFTAPAAFMAVFTAFFARAVLFRKRKLPGLPRLAGVCFLAGLLVLVAGLAIFGRDGRMMTYAGMAMACATVPWLAARAWRPG
jgi:amino acid transporter